MKIVRIQFMLFFLLGMSIHASSQPIIHLDFESGPWKSSRDTLFQPNLWQLYAHVGEVDPRKCALPQTAGKATIILTTEHVRSGTYAGKCVLDVSNGGIAHKAMFRNELLPAGTYTPDTKNEKWIRYSMYLPDTGDAAWVSDTLAEAVFQLHNDAVASPQLVLYCKNDTFSVTYRYADMDPHTASKYKAPDASPWKGVLPKGRWVDWVWHVKFSPLTPEGLLEVWKNEGNGYKKIVNKHSIRIGFPCRLITHFDIGVYKWNWKCPQPDAITKRTIYFDEAAVGDSSVTFRDMISAQETSSNNTSH